MIKRIIVLGAIALVAGTVFRSTTAVGSAVTPPSDKKNTPFFLGDNRLRWVPLWTRPAPDLAAMSLSPDGKTVAWVDHKGSVRQIDGTAGRLVYQTPALPGVNHLLAAPNRIVFAYSALNPMQPIVRALHPKWGNLHSHLYNLNGAIWGMAISPDGSKVIAGTGERFLYPLPLPTVGDFEKPNPLLPAWKTPGIPGSMTLSGNGSVALTETWQENGFSAWALDGTPLWQHEEAQPDRTGTVQLSADGSTAVAVTGRGSLGHDVRLDVWDALSGRLLWTRNLEAESPKALVSADGNVIAVSYAQVSTYRTGNSTEHKLALFDRAGNTRSATLGGPLFSPDLVALSADGSHLTVRDGFDKLFTLNSSGKFLARLRLPTDPSTSASPLLKEIIATPDGRYLLVRGGDGQISLYKMRG